MLVLVVAVVIYLLACNTVSQELTSDFWSDEYGLSRPVAIQVCSCKQSNKNRKRERNIGRRKKRFTKGGGGVLFVVMMFSYSFCVLAGDRIMQHVEKKLFKLIPQFYFFTSKNCLSNLIQATATTARYISNTFLPFVVVTLSWNCVCFPPTELWLATIFYVRKYNFLTLSSSLLLEQLASCCILVS